MTDDTDLSAIADYYASQGMSNPQLSYDANGNPIYTAGGNSGLPVDTSSLKDYAATLPAAAPNPLPTHEPYTAPASQDVYNALTGSNGVDRFQLFPERIVRSALSLPADVASGVVMTPSTMRSSGSEEDFSTDPLLQRVQDMAALMGGGGVAGAERGALGTAGGKLVQPATEEAIAPVFHSAVENAVNTASMKSAPPQQWLSTISNSKGVKPEELDWTGLKDWLGEQSGPVSKEQVQGYLQQNKVGLQEVNKGGGNSWSGPDETGLHTLKSEQPTKYSKYQLPGGENYREKLLTLPSSKKDLLPKDWSVRQEPDGYHYVYNTEGEAVSSGATPAKAIDNANFEMQSNAPRAEGRTTENYRSSHWDEPNIIAHIRMNDRNVEGVPALHVEEAQSDIHQAGREQGYKITDAQKKQLETIDNKLTSGLSEGDIGNPNMDQVLKTAVDKKVISQEEAKNYKDWSKGENSTIPNFPFKRTDQWTDLVVKRIIREAAEQGKTRISWTPGEAQAARYDLSKEIDELHYNKTRGIVTAYRKGAAVLSENATPEKLPDIIGKEATKKLLDEGKETTKDSIDKSYESYRLKGQQLKIGGEGMEYYYNKIFAKSMEKWTGQKMKVGHIESNRGYPSNFQLISNRGEHIKDFPTAEEARAWAHDNGVYNSSKVREQKGTPAITQPINYIDLPQSVKDTALHRGFPLFSSGMMLNPVQDDPFKKSKFKLVPVKEAPQFK
jgi:hypothetical protein